MTDMTETAVAEIVTYRLNDGVDEAGFLDLIARSQSFRRRLPRISGPQRLKGPRRKQWMDHVLWASMDEALSPQPKPLRSRISALNSAPHLAQGSVNIRHEHIMWQAE